MNLRQLNPKAHVVREIAKAVGILLDAIKDMEHIAKYDNGAFRYSPQMIKWFRRRTEQIAAWGGLLLKELKWEQECEEWDREVGDWQPPGFLPVRRYFKPASMKKASNE
jgi:hypothetical protein